jgi:hypothetical protein
MTRKIRPAIPWGGTLPTHHLAAPHAELVITKELS